MAIKERDVVLVSTNENNDTIIDMPVTRENCVEGLGRIRGTAYSVGDVVLCAGSMSLQLICTVAGTTSIDELDITGNAAGDSIVDGTVTWIVAKRNYFDNSGVLPISEGGTGADNSADACKNLGAVRSVNGVNADVNSNVDLGLTYFPYNADVYQEKALNDLIIPGIYSVKKGSDMGDDDGWQSENFANNGIVEVYRLHERSLDICQVFRRWGTVDSNSYQVYTRRRNAEGVWGKWFRIDSVASRSNTSATKHITKFTDGTMIIAHTGSTDNKGYITFPESFYDVPVVIAVDANTTSGDKNANALVWNTVDTTKSKARIFGDDGYRIAYIAMGRWKA